MIGGISHKGEIWGIGAARRVLLRDALSMQLFTDLSHLGPGAATVLFGLNFVAAYLISKYAR